MGRQVNWWRAVVFGAALAAGTAACGGDSDDEAGTDDDASVAASESGASESGGVDETEVSDDVDNSDFGLPTGPADPGDAPDGFPRDWIPPDHERGEFVDIPGFEGGTFESGVPIRDTIDYYTALLGPPAIEAEGDPGEWIANWAPLDDWVLGVLGDGTESVIAITRLPQ